MKILKIIILTLLISFLLFVASVYITFKYILTPERIKNYVSSYIEKTIDEQFEKYKKKMLEKISFSGLLDGKESKTEEGKNLEGNNENVESVDILEKFKDEKLLATKITKKEILQGVNDVNLLTEKVFSDVSIKMEKLKQKITEYFDNKDTKEGKNV